MNSCRDQSGSSIRLASSVSSRSDSRLRGTRLSQTLSLEVPQVGHLDHQRRAACSLILILLLAGGEQRHRWRERGQRRGRLVVAGEGLVCRRPGGRSTSRAGPRPLRDVDGRVAGPRIQIESGDRARADRSSTTNQVISDQRKSCRRFISANEFAVLVNDDVPHVDDIDSGKAVSLVPRFV